MKQESALKVRALVEEYIEERTREMTPRKERFSRQTWRRIAMATLLAGSAAVWFVPTSRGPKAPLQSTTRAEATLRVEASLAASRIKAFQTKHGRLPATLAEAGVYASTLYYTRESRDAFSLINSSGGLHVMYRSAAPDSTVGRAFRVLETKSWEPDAVASR